MDQASSKDEIDSEGSGNCVREYGESGYHEVDSSESVDIASTSSRAREECLYVGGQDDQQKNPDSQHQAFQQFSDTKSSLADNADSENGNQSINYPPNFSGGIRKDSFVVDTNDPRYCQLIKEDNLQILTMSNPPQVDFQSVLDIYKNPLVPQPSIPLDDTLTFDDRIDAVCKAHVRKLSDTPGSRTGVTNLLTEIEELADILKDNQLEEAQNPHVSSKGRDASETKVPLPDLQTNQTLILIQNQPTLNSQVPMANVGCGNFMMDSSNSKSFIPSSQSQTSCETIVKPYPGNIPSCQFENYNSSSYCKQQIYTTSTPFAKGQCIALPQTSNNEGQVSLSLTPQTNLALSSNDSPAYQNQLSSTKLPSTSCLKSFSSHQNIQSMVGIEAIIPTPEMGVSGDGRSIFQPFQNLESTMKSGVNLQSNPCNLSNQIPESSVCTVFYPSSMITCQPPSYEEAQRMKLQSQTSFNTNSGCALISLDSERNASGGQLAPSPSRNELMLSDPVTTANEGYEQWHKKLQSLIASSKKQNEDQANIRAPQNVFVFGSNQNQQQKAAEKLSSLSAPGNNAFNYNQQAVRDSASQQTMVNDPPNFYFWRNRGGQKKRANKRKLSHSVPPGQIIESKFSKWNVSPNLSGSIQSQPSLQNQRLSHSTPPSQQVANPITSSKQNMLGKVTQYICPPLNWSMHNVPQTSIGTNFGELQAADPSQQYYSQVPKLGSLAEEKLQSIQSAGSHPLHIAQQENAIVSCSTNIIKSTGNKRLQINKSVVAHPSELGRKATSSPVFQHCGLNIREASSHVQNASQPVTQMNHPGSNFQQSSQVKNMCDSNNACQKIAPKPHITEIRGIPLPPADQELPVLEGILFPDDPEFPDDIQDILKGKLCDDDWLGDD